MRAVVPEYPSFEQTGVHAASVFEIMRSHSPQRSAAETELETAGEGLRLYGTIRSYRHSAKCESLFRAFDFSALGGQIVCLLGASGTGKTTFLRILLSEHDGLFDGDVRYRVNEAELGSTEAARLGILGFVAPGDSLVPWKTVSENLLLPAHINPHLSRPDERSLADVINSLGLKPTDLNLLPHELSLGMRQRVQFSRLLVYRPRFSLLDEPFHGLDPANTKRLATALREYVTTSRTCCILVTHDVLTAQQTADDFLFLSRGGQVRQLSAQPTQADLLSVFQEDME